MSHYNSFKRRKYNDYNYNNHNGRGRWRNHNNYNNYNHNNRRWRGRGRGGRGRGNSNRTRNYHNNFNSRHNYNDYYGDKRNKNTSSDFHDISRMKLDDCSLNNLQNFHNQNDRYAPGGSEYERDGTATPASIRYMRYQSYSAAASPVYGLSQHESPSLESYQQIEDEYKQYLHELEVDDTYPRLPYRVRCESDKKDVIHFGQLKLLLSEIRFLTEYAEQGKVVIYAGAAPGHHIKYLSDLFPSHQFELYDPCSFSKQLENHQKITCHQEYFTNKLAKELGETYADQGILFMSDIRTADHRQMEEMENEKCIVRDNEWQRDWCQAMKPRKAMLKFRLPYPDRIEGPTQYLDGQIWLQSFARRSGTETRLVPIEGDDYSYTATKMYDHKQFEENLFFFNEKVRKVYVSNEFYDSSIGFENNFDCWSYGYLLERYLFYVVGMDVDETEDVFKKKKVLQMVREISESLNMKTDWFKFRQNKKSDYVEKYDMVDHRHFHQLNRQQVENEDEDDHKTIPLPQKVQKRKSRKRTYGEYLNEDMQYQNKSKADSSSMSAIDLDPIGFMRKIAKPFPNPDAWRDKIIEMIGEQNKKLLIVNNPDFDMKDDDDDDGKIVDALFKYLSGNKRQIEREDGASNQLNDIPVLLCINRLFAVFCIQIPPDCGFLNDSKFNNIYLMYGLCEASKIITAILAEDINELYLFGSVSHNDDNVAFKLDKIVGINQEFIAMRGEDDKQNKKRMITQKLLSIDANISFSN